MDTPEIAALLGCAHTDARVQAALRRFDIDDGPQVTIDEEDADGPVVEVQDWVVNNGVGIEFGFEDEASWRDLDEFERGRGSMILTQIYLYGEHPEVSPYRGPLPFGLQFADSCDVVRRKLGSLENTRRSYVRDSWETQEFRMIVSYVEQGARIGFVLCMLRPPRLPQPDYSLAPPPSVDAIIESLGKRWDDPAVRQAFAPLGMNRYLQDIKQGRSADFRVTHGLELGFHKRTLATGRSIAVFAYAVFYRDRELEARGWQGALPLGIQFDDSPEVVILKAGRPPDETADQEFTGYALWRVQGYSLHVYYSTMDNFVLRVRVMAPGVVIA